MPTIDTLLYPLSADDIRQVLAPTAISGAELALLYDSQILDCAVNADGTAAPFVLGLILLADELSRRLRDGDLSGPEVQVTFDKIAPEMSRLFSEALVRGVGRLDESYVYVHGIRFTFLRDAVLLFFYWLLTPRRA